MATHESHMHTGYTEEFHDQSAGTTFLRWLGRMVIMAVILFVVSFLTPGFSINGLWSYLMAAVVISLLDYLVELVMKVDASPFGKGLKGFVLAALILWLTQFLVPNMSVTIIGALIGALAIGILDAIFPTRTM
ncbi:MAG: phage holin family protein [Ruminococcaceae bacterium]|nr:phage holin family protein [Oscillospiraceae bacterium]HHV30897.1 phage holin family protein [Clostridiales bacterium]